MSTGTTALPDVQAAVYTKLTGDTALMALVTGGVVDYATQNTQVPYVYVESMSERPLDAFGSAIGSQGRAVSLTLAVLSDYPGRSEQYQILDALIRLLRYTALTIAGWTHLATFHLGTEAISLFDTGAGLAGQARVRFEIQVREAA